MLVLPGLMSFLQKQHSYYYLTMINATVILLLFFNTLAVKETSPFCSFDIITRYNRALLDVIVMQIDVPFTRLSVMFTKQTYLK